MHASSLENMQKCYRRYIRGTDLESRPCRVLDVGGSDVNGSYRAVFDRSNYEYVVADVDAGPNVSIMLQDPYAFPLPDRSADIVISGQAFEHIEFFWRTFAEMVRVLKPDGVIVLIAPSAGPEHRYPVDCYRFYADAYRALANSAKIKLLEVWCDERGPWRDLVGVFRHADAAELVRSDEPCSPPPTSGAWTGTPGTPEREKLAGKAPYLDVLQRLHHAIVPRLYLEIGVRKGRSLALARGAAIGIDPAPEIEVRLPPTVQVVSTESDSYFDRAEAAQVFDFALVDGLHVFEQALRDFMNIERRSRPGSALLIDDIFPNHSLQASRVRQTQAWMGDVWKLAEVLRAHRPDLFVAALDTHPSGMLLVGGLDPSNRVLWDSYNPIVREHRADRDPPPEVLTRADAIDPGSEYFSRLLGLLARNNQMEITPAQAAANLRSAGSPRVPALSVVVICYNMAREIVRTVKSLSPAMQRGISAEDYEIIVVDNGSSQPFDEAQVLRLAPNVRILRVEKPTVSPVPAINLGLAQARGGLVGVCIDGARMASPGLLAAALEASRLHSKPAIGTIAFHLGHDVQQVSTRGGYDQAAEDALLAAAGWEADGYRLFDVSVLAASSAEGWFSTPAESNAIFLRADHWRELGGYDPGFVSPGGGFANLDAWARVCADSTAEVVLLLGEATFHQVHGGVSTNNARDDQTLYNREYEALRGRPYQRPTRRLKLYGALPAQAAATVKLSASRLGG